MNNKSNQEKTGKNILIIDDMRENLVTAKVLFKKLMPEHQIFTSQSAKEGFEIAKKIKPDTILLDVQMPEMDGFEATKLFKSEYLTKNIPIIIVTALTGNKENKIKALECGADAFISKPLDHSELIAVVNSMLRIKAAEDMLNKEKNKLVSDLFKSESLFQSVFNSAPSIMLILDVDLIIQTWNPMANSLFEFNKNPMDSYTLFDVTGKKESERENIKNKIEEALAKNETYKFESEHLTKNKQKVLVWKIAGFTDSHKKTIGYVALGHDITERKGYEIKEIEARKKAEEADKLKTAFLANMSHEIRTPMNAIIGFSSLLSLSDLSTEKKDLYIQQIGKSSDQLLKLIDDILDISKIEAGKIDVFIKNVEINSLMKELFFTFQNQNKSAEGISLILSLPFENEEYWIKTDPDRLSQVLTNLLNNALKFTDFGTVELGYLVENNNIEFYVRDTGIGIPKDKQSDIFERFFKLDDNKNKFYGGTGLGLSISKDLVEIMGGKIGLESELNEGTIVFVSFPIKESQKTFDNSLLLSDLPFSLPDWQGKKILIAEDEEINFLFLQETLLDTGIDITWVQNGVDALELIQHNEHFDLVLMDMKMPIMDGFESTKKIRRISNIKIVAQTAYAMENEVKRCYEVGCNYYLSKPIIREELFSTLHTIFESQKTH